MRFNHPYLCIFMQKSPNIGNGTETIGPSGLKPVSRDQCMKLFIQLHVELKNRRMQYSMPHKKTLAFCL